MKCRIANAIIDAWILIAMAIILLAAIESLTAKAAAQASPAAGQAAGIKHCAGFDGELLQSLPVIYVTEAEREHMAHVVMAEAEGEPYEGKIAVANTIINRSRNRGQSVTEVIFAPAQFCSTGRRFNLQPNDDCYKAVDAALAGYEAVSTEVEYFCENSIQFDYLTYVKNIGSHDFYKEDKQ